MWEWLSGMMGGQGNAGTTIGPGAMSHMSPDQWGTKVPQSSGGGIFADPNFQSFLAGAGASLDPEGVGGAVGKATQGVIQNRQMGKAMEKQDRRWSALIEAMAGGKVGSATIKEDGKGGTSVSLKAPEGLGSLSAPTQEQVSPFQEYMSNMQGWFAKYQNGGM